MKYRRLGRAGIKISEISLGGWLTFGETVDVSATDAILGAAVDCGINFIDLADIYAHGEAERVCGQALKSHGRSDLVVSSKLYWPMSRNVNDRGLSRKHIMESIDKTLTRLGTDYLDIYFCHRYDPDTEIEEVVRAMDDLVHRGKILYWGTSVWKPDQIAVASALADQYRCHRPQVEQPRYNMLDRSIERQILPTCARLGMGLTVWSPLAQGLLTGKYNDGVPDGSRGSGGERLRKELTEANLTRVRRLTELAAGLELTMTELALAWALRRPEISCVITGATTPEQVRANVAASDVELTAETLAAIEIILG